MAMLVEQVGSDREDDMEAGQGQASVEMPKYRSHKIVHALKISEIVYNYRDLDGWENGAALLYPAESSVYAAFKVSPDFVKRHLFKNDGQGEDFKSGYYVVYSDGYQSFSPTDAFEEGYTRL